MSARYDGSIPLARVVTSVRDAVTLRLREVDNEVCTELNWLTVGSKGGFF
jgi:hypothetical protein